MDATDLDRAQLTAASYLGPDFEVVATGERHFDFRAVFAGGAEAAIARDEVTRELCHGGFRLIDGGHVRGELRIVRIQDGGTLIYRVFVGSRS